MRTRRLLLTAASLVVAASLLGACGSSGGDAVQTKTSPTKTSPAKGCRTAAKAKAQTKAPKVDPPSKAVTGIHKVDGIVGCGAVVKATSTVTVQYILKSKSSGQVVDSSWSRNEPFDVTLGQGQVISGWDQGIPGMRVGGERTLTLGPDAGYGPQGSPPAIAANDTLVFVMDLQKIG